MLLLVLLLTERAFRITGAASNNTQYYYFHSCEDSLSHCHFYLLSQPILLNGIGFRRMTPVGKILKFTVFRLKTVVDDVQ